MKIKLITWTAIVGIALSMGFSACTDLSETVYNVILADNFGQTDAQVFSIVGSAYAGLRGGAYDGQRGYAAGEYIYYIGALASDEAILPAVNAGADWLDGYRYMEFLFHDFSVGSEATTGAWRYCYQNITNINNIMSQTIDPLPMDSTAKLPIYAELRALRAYYYFRLLDWFGNVPIVKNFNDTTLPATSPRAEVFQFTIGELEEVVENLPATGYGRMTKNAGLCLLSRLYLNGYVFTKSDYGESNNYAGDPDGYYAKAIEACDLAIANGGQLEPNYFTNFLEQNQVSNEILLSIVYDNKNDGTGAYGNWHVTHTTDSEMKWMVSTTGQAQFGYGTIRAKPGVVASFEPGDLRKKTIAVGKQYYKSDPTKVITFELNEKGATRTAELDFIDDIGDIIDARKLEGAHWTKYELVENDNWCSNHDLVLMRYAEILLNKAEALIRKNGAGDAEAQSLMKTVRDRAWGGSCNQLTIADLAHIELERRHEFGFEDMRRTDMIRFGSFTKLGWIQSAWPKQVTERTLRYGSYTTLYPIPALEIAKNPKLQQNPGY